LVPVIAALLALVFVSSAGALTQRPFKETFGSAAQPSFEWSRSVAIDKGSGDVLVGDSGTIASGFLATLSRFHADGTPAPFAALGTNVIDGMEANGKPCAEEPASCDQTPQNKVEFGEQSSQLAIDESGGPTDGDIYLSQPASQLVDIFSADGEYLGQLTKAGLNNFPGGVDGVAVDETGAVYVSAGGISKFVPSANPPVNTDLVSVFPLAEGDTATNVLAIGAGPSAGSIFVAYNFSNGTSHVSEYDRETGDLKYKFAEGYGFNALAVDPNSGTVLTGSTSGQEVGEFEATGESKPVKVGRLVSPRPDGFALNGASEVVVAEGPQEPHVRIFGTPAPVPVITVDPANEVTGTKATVSGTVNPGGLPVTECYFGYDGTQVPCAESPATIGEGNSPVPVHADLSGLEPNGHSYTFRFVAVNANGFEESSGTFTTLDTVVAEAATAIGETTATLNGTVRPEGDQYTACTFEYGLSTSASFEQTVPCQPGAAAISPDYFPHAVKAPLSGLQSGLTYRYRLVATNSAGTIKTEELTFSTFGVPRIDEVRASDADQSSVNLEASINPSGFGTSYRIEWGPTGTYGNVTPAEFEPFLGSGTDPVQVKSRLSGLAAGSLYHYRLIARSSRGVTQSPDHVVETLSSCGLPEGRCFEIVSRRDAGPIAVPGESNAAIEMHFQAATGGAGGLAYPVEGGYPEATKGADVQYRALRTPNGWESTQLSPPILALNERTGVNSVSSATQWLSDDLSCGFTESINPLTADPSMRLVRENGASNLYRINPDGSYTGVSNLAPENSEGLEGTGNYIVAGASRNCDKVVFASRLTYPGIPGEGDFHVYEWDEGTLRNVGVVPGLGGEETVVEAHVGGLADGGHTNYVNAVSEDGSRVFFTAERQTSPSGAEAIFMREDGAVTRDLSLSQTGTPAGDALYQWATADGSKVFFTANAGLTDESNSAGTDLYEYDLETEELTDRSITTAAGGAEVSGFLAASADGSQVYFASRNQLIPGRGNSRAQNVKANTYSIYGERDGEFTFAGTFSADDSLHVLIQNQGGWTSQASPDGRYLLFESSAKVTGYDSAGLGEAYLYDANAGTTTCVSCRQDGQPSADNRYDSPEYTVLPRGNFLQSPLHPPRFLTVRNGEPQVFFSSPDPLAPGAVAGQNNIYEWSHDQVFRLVSSDEGTQTGHLYAGFSAVFGGASDDGSDVYLITPETLTWEDGDQRLSAYDARIGGGFPQPSAAPAPCNVTAEGSCQGAAQGGPAVPGAASATFNGPGNSKAQAHKKKHKKKHKKHNRHRGKKHNKNKGKKNGKSKQARHANGKGRTGK
jgi:Tol biopolymer transport system component